MKILMLLLFPVLVSASSFGPALPKWRVVNDTVMGGVSQSSATPLEDGLVRFSGVLSLENRGGFASIRADHSSYAMAGQGSLVVKVRGDGRTYTVDLRTQGQAGATSWKQTLQTTAGEVTEHHLPISGFVATAFGRRIPMAGQLDPSSVRSFGFMLADKSAGPFRLDVLEVAFEPAAAPDRMPMASQHAGALIHMAIDRGVPLYNRGDHDACAAVYEITANALLMMSEAELPRAARAQLEKELAALEPHHSPSQRAWALRHALDGVMVKMMER